MTAATTRASASSSENERLLSASGGVDEDGGESGYGTVPSDGDATSAAADNNGHAHANGGAAVDEPKDRSTAELALMLAGLYTGAFLVALDATLVGTLSAPISASFGNMRLLGWLASSYFIANCASQPIVGKITDIFGRKKVMLIASVLFSAGNLMCAVAQKEWVLLTGRVVAGLGGGCIGPISTFVMSDLIPLRRRGVWQGLSNVCFAVGTGIGGPFGGWMSDALTWRWAFAVQVPITVISVLLIMITLPETVPMRDGEDQAQKLKRVDWLGSLTLVTFLVLLLLGLNTGGNILPWSHPAIIACFPLSAIFFLLFVLVEGRYAAEPILPLSLFKNRTITAAGLANWFGAMARFGLLFYAPLIFQVQGYSAAQTGLRLVPEALATAVSSLGCGLIMRATGRYYLLSICVTILQVLGVSLVSSIDMTTPAWSPFLYLFIGGIGFSGIITTTLIAMIAAIDQQWQAVVTSASYAFRSTGSVIGITVASAVFQNVLVAKLWVSLGERDDASELIDAIRSNLHAIDGLSEPLKRHVQETYLASLSIVFKVLIGFILLALISVSFMREHKLHARLSRR